MMFGDPLRGMGLDQRPQIVVRDPPPSTHTITNGRIATPVTPDQPTSWRSDPTWKPAGFDRQSDGRRNGTSRNFAAGHQTSTNAPHTRGLEDDVTNAAKSGETISLGVLPVHKGTDPAVPPEIRRYAVGNKGYRLDCTVCNRATGGYPCSQRSSGAKLPVP